jgi:hypothetical protein
MIYIAFYLSEHKNCDVEENKKLINIFLNILIKYLDIKILYVKISE